MILKNAMEITFARVELTSSELEISFPIHPHIWDKYFAMIDPRVNLHADLLAF